MNYTKEMSLIETEVAFEDVNCPLGCIKIDEILFTGRDLINYFPGEYTVVKCCNCGLMRTNPRPTADSIGFYYPDNYGPYSRKIEQNDQTKLKRNRIKSTLRPLVRWFFDSKAEALPDLPQGRLLEIGCASGYFLYRMSQLGWQVEGIEFSETAAQASRDLGFSVHSGSLEKAPAPVNPPNLVVEWMVLEHLHEPINCLKKLHEWTEPDARLVLSVPNANSFDFGLFKKLGYALQLPHHLYHYTPQTLANVLNSSGWSLEKIHHQRSVTNLILSTARVLESKGFFKIGKLIRMLNMGRKWFYILFPFACILSYFGQSGRMTVWAKKIKA
jgi:2-polyprenyl-3-methyl-5-hydroxy-6-metoxy-1,4-benzoquinol methylase